jgi:hydroxymethylbilane synthase
MPLPPHLIKVGARDSPLSRKQVEEVEKELQLFRPELQFAPTYVKTAGDYDKKTSLRSLEKTDFFTKEVDALLLQGICDITIHSAKDLPEPLTAGLSLIALTRGQDPRDALVMRGHSRFDQLPTHALIATSSLRREENVRLLRSDLKFVDIRGTIEERLERLYQKEIDALVVAEAALIRLGLTTLNRMYLPGEVALNQGRLALLARQDNSEMKDLFSPIDENRLSRP